MRLGETGEGRPLGTLVQAGDILKKKEKKEKQTDEINKQLKRHLVHI